MAGSVNKAVLIGNLGHNPSIKTTKAGDKVCSLSVATSESWKDKATGERHERTEWHNVVIFNQRLVDIAGKYLAKGMKVYIEGRIETRKYTGRDGTEKYTTEIVLRQFDGELQMLSASKGDRPPPADDPDAYGSVGHYPSSNAPSPAKVIDDMNDEIPF